MPGSFALLGHQIATLWKHFGINQKVSIVLALLATAAAIAATLYWSSRPDFRLLYSGMTMEDAARARERLDDEKIAVQLRNNGQTLYVPSADVYRARLLLAASGLPKDSSTGFELFEQPKFGLTEFAQQVNFQRALQGELERTITAVEGVQAARVMLVMPKDRLFSSKDEKTASASIMLTLQRGARLSGEQVHSINQLASTAVPGLSDGQITITDHQGNLLSDANGGSDPMIGNSQRQIDIRRFIEADLTRKAQDMLDLSLGQGNAIVRVSADVDFRRVERHNETFDAEGRVLARETISSESSSDPIRSPADGTARVAVGDPRSTVTMEQAMSKTKREDVDAEYRIPSATEIIVDQGGNVSRLSVSVSVARGEEPRSAADLQGIERMVRSAVGATDTRLDTVEVIEMAFRNVIDQAPQPAMPLVWMRQLPFSLTGALRVLGGLALLITLFIISRRTFAQLSIERENVGTPISMLAGGGESHALNAGQPMAMPNEDESDFDTISRLAEQNPAAVATWIDHTVRSHS